MKAGLEHSAWDIKTYRNGGGVADEEQVDPVVSPPVLGPIAAASYGVPVDEERADPVGNRVALGPIAAASYYYLKEDHTTPLISELKKNFLLALVCLSGAYLYWLPAVAYAKRLGWEKISWLFGIGTCIPALSVLYVATDTFLKFHSSSVIPKELSHVLVNPQTRAQRTLENVGIGVGSAVSAVPLASVVFAFPPEGMKLGWLILLSSIVLIDNTILHFLPVKLVLNQDKYLSVFLPLVYLWRWSRKWCQNRNLSDVEKRQAAYNAQKASDHQTLKQLMIARINLAQTRMNEKSFTWRKRGWNYKYEVKVPDEVRQLLDPENTSDPLSLILNFLPDEPGSPRSSYQLCGVKLHTIGLNLFRILGAFWIWSSISGYYIAPFNEFYRWTKNYWISGLAAALPDYSMSVLVAFFGDMIGSNLYNYATSWGEHDVKIPLAVKYYPKLFMLAMTVNVLLSPFSPAAAVELVYSGYQNYQWAKPLIPTLFYLAFTGIMFLSLSAVRDFACLMFTKMATYAGSENVQTLAKANERIEQYKNSIHYMDGDALEKELIARTALQEDEETVFVGMGAGEGGGGGVRARSMNASHKELEKMLGISHQEFQGIANHEENFRSNYKPNNRSWCSWFSSGSGGEEEPLMDLMNGLVT